MAQVGIQELAQALPRDSVGEELVKVNRDNLNNKIRRIISEDSAKGNLTALQYAAVIQLCLTASLLERYRLYDIADYNVEAITSILSYGRSQGGFGSLTAKGSANFSSDIRTPQYQDFQQQGKPQQQNALI
jgi:hypothetical protein